MGFHASVAPTLITTEPLVSAPQEAMTIDCTPAPAREPSHEPPLWPSLAVLG